MISQLHAASDSFQILTRGYVENGWLQAATGLLLLGAFAWTANWVAKRTVLTLLLRLAISGVSRNNALFSATSLTAGASALVRGLHSERIRQGHTGPCRSTKRVRQATRT